MTSLCVYRAIVIDNDDPLGICRVKVQIPGVFDGGRVEDYPWITYLAPFSGSVDSGNYMVPLVGDYIFVMELTDYDYVWFGACNSVVGKPQEGTNLTTKVLYKSSTGHTIIMDDTLEEEKLQIIDRAGQIFEFLCALKNDAGPRGTGTVKSGRYKTLDALIDVAQIRIKDIAGSEWVMQSKTGENKFWLTHADGNKIEVTSDVITITSKFGSTITMDETKIKVRATDTCFLELNLSTGRVSISTDGGIEATSSTATLEATGAVNVRGSQVILNNGSGGIVSHANWGIDPFTGTPIMGSPTEKSN